MLITGRIGDFIRAQGLAEAGQRIVVGVSGGPDSLCLLDCLCRLGFPVLVAHLDHRLRARSWRHAEFVLRLARDRGLPSVVERARPETMRRHGTSLEEAARLARYRFLAEAARSWDADRIATGHTADDQAETVLMHFLRGAGVGGLRGMLPRTSLGEWVGLDDGDRLTLIRPLLEATRQETEAHCRAAGLRPRVDPTNRDPRFFRNRLRHRLLPTLERYNPRIREVLSRTARVMAREAEMVDDMVETAAAEVLSQVPGGWEIDRRLFLRQPTPVQAGLILLAAGRLAPHLRDFGFEAVELARRRIARPARGRRTSLPGNLELLDQGETVALYPAGVGPALPGYPQVAATTELSLDVPGRVDLLDGGLIVASFSAPPTERRTVADWRGLTRLAWLDADRVRFPLTVRRPRLGERMQPLGMDGRRKIADIFNSLHVPPAARAAWPVVVSGDDVVWLTGLRLGQEARLTEATRRAIRLDHVPAGERAP